MSRLRARPRKPDPARPPPSRTMIAPRWRRTSRTLSPSRARWGSSTSSQRPRSPNPNLTKPELPELPTPQIPTFPNPNFPRPPTPQTPNSPNPQLPKCQFSKHQHSQTPNFLNPHLPNAKLSQGPQREIPTWCDGAGAAAPPACWPRADEPVCAGEASCLPIFRRGCSTHLAVDGGVRDQWEQSRGGRHMLETGRAGRGTLTPRKQAPA